MINIVNMAKKLEGDTFLLSANDLKTGEVLFYTSNGWLPELNKAIKIEKKYIEKYEKILKIDEENCLIVSGRFVELNDSGSIKNLRDKIRSSGLTFKI